MPRAIWKTALFLLAALATSCGQPPAEQSEPSPSPPSEKPEIKLVATIVIDMLRADAVANHRPRLGEGGFARLIEQGVWYHDAKFPYATTLTAVGHASIHTGGTPADHGIVGNYWFDRRTHEVIKSVEGPDPSDQQARLDGPMQLTSTTVGDELSLASGDRSRVFSVSIKDRGAILPGGYRGKAFWYSVQTGGFTTSRFYYPAGEPAWLADWNGAEPADRYRNRAWELLADRAGYVRRHEDDRPEEKPYNEPFGRTAAFPHTLEGLEGEELYRQLPYTPFGDELTMELALEILQQEKLGKGEHVDLLAVSFSATDYIGHAWGPASLEYEDNLLRLDALLARFFEAIDEAVGLEHTLIALTSDHGVDMIPEYRQRLGLPAGRIDPADFARVIDAALQQEHGTDLPFAVGFRNPSVYLNLETVAKLGLDIAEVEADAARAVMTIDGIAAAVTRSDLLAGRVPDSRLMRTLKVAFHPARSGNVLVLQEPFWFLYHSHDQDSAMHGAPYEYDTHVPLFFAGPGIEPRTVDRPVTPLDVAPTISRILGIARPSGCRGEVLVEVLGD